MAPLIRRVDHAVLFLTVLGISASPARSGAQITTRAPVQAPTITKTVTVLPTPLSTQRFRTGLQVSGAPHLPTSGPTPLLSVTLSWAPYPGATAYEVLRQALTSSGAPYGAVVIPTAPLRPPLTTATVSGIPPYPIPNPAWGRDVQFRVVAIVSGHAADTTAPVAVQLPKYHPQQNSLVSSAVWPAPASADFASVGARVCQITGTTGKTAWARNPAAVSYSVDLIQNEPVGYVEFATPSTTDTVFSPTLPAGMDLIMVRPEFSVPDWPAAGQSYALHGEWVYLGTAHSPAASGATAPCTQH